MVGSAPPGTPTAFRADLSGTPAGLRQSITSGAGRVGPQKPPSRQSFPNPHKWQKRYNKPSQNSSGEFLQFNELYILNQSTFHKIKRKPQLIKALKDREKEIKAYLKEQHIFIGSGDVGNIKQVVDYYNTLQQ